MFFKLCKLKATDVWVDGKLLPKNSTLILNVWQLHQDEKRYPNPDLFNPDRFQGYTGFSAEYTNVADPEKRDHYAYGKLACSLEMYFPIVDPSHRKWSTNMPWHTSC